MVNMIIALEGARAVGKTTLLDNIRKVDNSIKVFHGYKYRGKNFDLNSVEGFCANQLIYIRQKLEQYATVDDAETNLITRGTEDIIFYTLNYPRIMGCDWNVELRLDVWISKLKAKKSDAIIYLDATDEIILKRNDNDTRNRSDLENWLTLWQDEMRHWFSSCNNCVFVDTSQLTATEVADEVFELIKKIRQTRQYHDGN